jgi:NADH-quinone oxidoreductase E subunit
MVATTSRKLVVQPESFVFSAEVEKEAQRFIKKYPENHKRSAVLPLLDLAQRQAGGWLPRAAIEHVAIILEMPVIRVYEVASFYTMFNLAPVGKHLVQLCRTTPCWLRGSDNIRQACERHLGIGLGETTADDKFTLVEVECLGACVNAPVVQINDDYFEDLTAETVTKLLDDLSDGKPVVVGSQTGRKCSSPQKN